MRLSKYIALGMFGLALCLSGCGSSAKEDRQDLSFLSMNQDALLDSETYPHLNALLGNMTAADLLSILDTCLAILNESDRLGYTSTEDYATLLRILTNLRDTMGEEISSEALDTTMVADISAIMDIMTGTDTTYPNCQIGPLFDELIQRLGPGILRDQVQGMLAYAMLMDTSTVANAVSGFSLSALKDTNKKAAFTDLMSLINGFLDPAGNYANLYQGLLGYSGATNGTSGILDRLGGVSGSTITLGDFVTVLDDLKAVDFSTSGFMSAATESRIDNAITAVEKIIAGQASSFTQAEIENIVTLVSQVVSLMSGTDTSGINETVLRDTVTELLDLFANDSAARAELAGVLYSLARLLNSGEMSSILSELDGVLDESGLTSDKTLQTLLTNVLAQLPSVSNTGTSLPNDLFGTASSDGILTKIADDYSQYGKVDEGLLKLIEYDSSGTERTSTTQESALLSLLKAMQNADWSAEMAVNATLLTIDMIALNVVYPQYNTSGSNYSNCTKDSTTNISQFMVGELVRAIKYRYGVTGASVAMGGAPSSADRDGLNGVTPEEALYWLLWTKRYHAETTVTIFTMQADYTGLLDFAFMQLTDLTSGLLNIADNMMTPSSSTYGLDMYPPISNSASHVYQGRLRDYIPALAALSGWNYTVTKDSNGHVTAVTPTASQTGPQHTLISLMWPLMDYFWSNGQTAKLISLLESLLDSSTITTVSGVKCVDYKKYNSSYPTTTARVLQDLEGTNGAGLLTQALSTHGTNDEGLLDNALPLICKIVNQLDSAGVLRTNTNNLTAELTTSLEDWVDASAYPASDPDALFVNKLNQTLFTDTDSQGRTAIYRTRLFLQGNSTALATLCDDLGDLLTQGGTSLDPLIAYIPSSNFFTNLNTIWDGGTILDTVSADFDSISADVQTITDDTDFDFMESLTTLLGDLEDLDTAPVDIGNKPATALLRFLLKQNTSSGANYNPFVDNLLYIVCNALNLYDEEYNTAALVSPTGISENTTVVDAVGNLTGSYDLQPLINLLTALTEKTNDDGDLVLYKLLVDVSTIGDAVLGDEEMPTSILECLLRDMPVKGTTTSAVGVILDQVDLSGIANGTMTMQDIFDDLQTLFGGVDIAPGGDVYHSLYQVLDFAVQNVQVRE